jgi:hypothetical protein
LQKQLFLLLDLLQNAFVLVSTPGKIWEYFIDRPIWDVLVGRVARLACKTEGRVNNQYSWQSKKFIYYVANKQTYHPTPLYKLSRYLLVIKSKEITITMSIRTYPEPVQPNLEVSVIRCVSNSTLQKALAP